MKRLDEISNPIVRGIIAILFYITLAILLIPAIPYAIVREGCNLEYYNKWFKFVYHLNKK